MTTKPESLLHMSGGKAISLATHIDAAQPSAPGLCAASWPYPVAIELARLIKLGAACVPALRQMGFSSQDAITTSAAIVSRGAH
jgi:hypothetical protein